MAAVERLSKRPPTREDGNLAYSRANSRRRSFRQSINVFKNVASPRN
nr:MAG TPA: hypothetical protein [Caudoviricetes sp.]